MGMVQHTDQINNRVGERVLPGERACGVWESRGGSRPPSSGMIPCSPFALCQRRPTVARYALLAS
jgi:hypothetical protein